MSMEHENSVYVVTYPDLYMTGMRNISVLFLGMTTEQTDKLQSFIEEKYYENEIVFYVTNKPIDDQTIAWASAISKSVELVFANVDSINSIETALALTMYDNDNSAVVFVSLTEKSSALSNLLDHLGIKVFINEEEFKEFVAMIIEHSDEGDESDSTN